MRIERGGRALMFLAGVALVVFALDQYRVTDVGRWLGWRRTRPAPVATGPAAVRVRVSRWTGCLPGLTANGGLETTSGSIFAKAGLKVSFQPGDWAGAASALTSDHADVLLTTADVWAKDYPQSFTRDVRAHAILLADWSRGADAILAREGIRRVEDLAAKSVAFVPGTPSEFLLWSALKGSRLTGYERKDLYERALRTSDAEEAASLLERKKVDAAVVWAPDAGEVPGAVRLFDTSKTDTLIADILVVSDRFAGRNPQVVKEFVEGWLAGVNALQSQRALPPSLAKELDIPLDRLEAVTGRLRLAGATENASFFGSEHGSEYARVFQLAQQMYREQHVLNSASDPESSLDRSYVDELKNRTAARLFLFPRRARPGRIEREVSRLRARGSG